MSDAYDDYEARNLNDMAARAGRPPRSRGRNRSTPAEDFAMPTEEPVVNLAPQVDGFGAHLFGDGYIFFPAETTLGELTRWKDPHACHQCGALVLLPQAHIQFHIVSAMGSF